MMRVVKESRGTQTNQVIGQPQQIPEIDQQAVGVVANERAVQNIQIIEPLSRQQSSTSLNQAQQQRQNEEQEAIRNQDCYSNTSPTMRIFVIVATFFMGLYDIIAYLLGGIKRLIPQPLSKLFDSKCTHHQPDDISMDCSNCQQNMQLPGRQFTEKDCAICYNPIKNKVFYQCQHSCCAECTIKYWENCNQKKINCMYCRKQIDMIYRDFKADNNKRIELQQKIRNYNSKFAPKDRSLISKIRECPFLLQRTLNFIFTREGVMYMLGHMCSSHFFIVGLLYIISPLDLLPECIFGIFGLLDDVVVMGILFVLLTNFYYRYLLRQDQDNSQNESN